MSENTRVPPPCPRLPPHPKDLLSPWEANFLLSGWSAGDRDRVRSPTAEQESSSKEGGQWWHTQEETMEPPPPSRSH